MTSHEANRIQILFLWMQNFTFLVANQTVMKYYKVPKYHDQDYSYDIIVVSNFIWYISNNSYKMVDKILVKKWLFALKSAYDMAGLYENDAFLIFVLSTKKLYSSLLKKVFIFEKICFKVKVLKSFKFFTDCHIKTCQYLKRLAIYKIPSLVF